MLLFLLLLTFIISSDDQLKCGDDLNYVFEDGTLTISGTGQMYNFTSQLPNPWAKLINTINKIIIEEGVTSIGDNAFYGCQYIQSVELSNTITYIGNYAFQSILFYGYTNFSLIIPNSVNYIGYDAFYGSNLNSVQISNSLEIIKESTFGSCKYLQSLEIPEGVVTIKDAAFSECIRLANVTFPSTLQNLYESAFYLCQKIESIVIPDSVVLIGGHAFEECTSLVSISLPNQLTELKDSLFNECTSLKSVNIPEELITIEYGVFLKCKNLSSINLPSGVTSIGSEAFNGCTKLASIEIPKGVTVINGGMFQGCNGLQSLTILGDITKVGSYAFSGCSKLASIQLPDTVTLIENHAFQYCKFKSFNVPSGITSIPENCFTSCKSLNNLSLPEGITSIGKNSFSNCESLETIDFPKSMETIGDNAFNNCDLRNIKLHENVKTIGKAVFQQNLNLDYIEVDEKNKVFKSIDGILFYNPSSLRVFPSHKNVSFYEIPAFVKSIASSAFQNAQYLETVIIHAGVTSIGEDAFSYSPKLSSVTYYGTKEPTTFPQSFFRNCPLLTSVNVTTNYTANSFGYKPVNVMKNDDDIYETISANEGNELTSENVNDQETENVQNSNNDQKSENVQISNNNQETENVQISNNDQKSENVQISNNDQKSENIQISEEEIIPTVTPTPQPVIVIVDIPPNANETVLDDILTEHFKNNSFSDNNNKVIGFTNNEISFNSNLEPNQFIKPMNDDSKIVYKGGNLNLVLPTDGKVTVSIENDKSSLSINGEGQIVIDKSDSQSSSVEIESKSRINGSVTITISEKIDTLTIDSIEFDKNSSLSINNNDPSKLANLNVKDVSTKQNSKVSLHDASILNSLTVSQSSTIALHNVSLKNANVNFDLNNNNWTPFLNGVFNDPPKNIFLNKVSDDNNSPSKNKDYTLIVGQFEENKCEEWLSIIEYKNSGFNSKTCEDNNEKLLSYENKKIVIKSTDKKGKGLNGGQIAGIVVGCVAAVAIVVVVVIIVLKKKNNAKKSESESI